MKLTIFNGSPRGEESNTQILLNHFLEGFTITQGNSYELLYLKNLEKSSNFVESFKNAEKVLLAFPLYMDAMPTIVKSFIESLQPLCARADNPDIGLIVQSGLPETIHSRCLEQYLKKLTSRLGCGYIGTVIKGGMESIRMHSQLNNTAFQWFFTLSSYLAPVNVGHLLNVEKLYSDFFNLGNSFGRTGQFDREIVQKLAQPETFSKFGAWAFKFIGDKLYWAPLSKQNNAYAKISAKPYIKNWWL